MGKSEEGMVEVIESEIVEETEEPGEDKEKSGEEAEEGDGTEKEKDAETGKKESRGGPDEETSAPKKKKSGMPMVGLTITVLGAIGVAGAVVLDPMMNMMDPSHPADIAIGSMQMIGIAVAAIVLVVGIVITVLMRKKDSTY